MFSSHFRQQIDIRKIGAVNLPYIALALLGSFSIYFSAYFYKLPSTTKLMIDSTTVASIAMDFYLVVVICLLAMKFVTVCAQALMIGLFLVIRKRRSTRSLAPSSYLIVVVRFLTRNRDVLKVAFFFLAASYGLLGFFWAGFFLFLVLPFFMTAATLFQQVFAQGYRVELVLRDASISVLIMALSFTCWFAGRIKFAQNLNEIVVVETSSGSGRHVLLFRNADGLVFKRVNDDGSISAEVTFMPYGEMKGFTSVPNNRVLPLVFWRG